MVESSITINRLIAVIMAFHDTYPSVPVESIKQLVQAVGDITTDFALGVTREEINKIISKYEDN